MKKINLIIFLLTSSFACIAIADQIPIEDFSTQATPTQTTTLPLPQATQQQLSLDQRVAKLEQQMQNTNRMNMPARIDQLQQEVQKLQGEVDTEQHDIQILTEQLHNFYQDLDQRINNNQPQKTNTAATTKPTTAKSPEDIEYQAAFNLLHSKNYDQAELGMQKYLNDYPHGKYAVNAHYWLGEIYYLQSQLVKSINEFQVVISQYPDSAKVPDSMLKLAMIYSQDGDYKKAHQEFQEIKKKYPNSNAAQLMNQQLKKPG
jgi:tol-pal system protein YbgF